MVDGEIRLSTGVTIAVVLWVGALTWLGFAWLFNDSRFGWTAVITGQFAALMTVRQIAVRSVRILRNGFDLGRDSVRPLTRL